MYQTQKVIDLLLVIHGIEKIPQWGKIPGAYKGT